MSDTEARDVLAEAYTRFDWENGFTSRAIADAGLAALREHGFAVVRTDDVGILLEGPHLTRIPSDSAYDEAYARVKEASR